MKKKLTNGDLFLFLRSISRVMRISLFLILVGTALAYSGVSYSQNTKFTLDFENVTLKEVFQAIEEQSEFIFFYPDQLIDLNRRVSLRVSEENIHAILDKLFSGTLNTFTIKDRQVVIGRTLVLPQIKTPALDLASKEKIIGFDTPPQPKVISGTITDSRGDPLPGVNVLIKGTTTGTITDLNGRFQLSISPDDQVLVVSFIGMVTQEIPIGDRLVFNVIMEEDIVDIEEVVVVGYGVQKKESVVGAISQATGDAIRSNIQGGDLGTALIGAIPGMITLRTTGVPGGMDFGRYTEGSRNEPIQIFIRGVKTWNDAAPLILVDGVEREMHNVNPQDIDQISILKDASATSVFGVKGANGVILITTRRGREGKARLTFNYTTTAKTLSRLPEKAGSYLANYAKNLAILNEISVFDSWSHIKPEKWLNHYKTQRYPDYFPDVDWQDLMVKDFAIDHTMNMTVSGGSEFVKYYGALSYLSENDLINSGDIGQGYDPSFNFQRINLRSNLDFAITNTTTFSTNLAGNYYNQRRNGSVMYGYKGIWGMAPDVYPLRYRDGTYGDDNSVINGKPPYIYMHYLGYNTYKGVEINTDFMLTQKLDFFLKGLSAKAKMSYDNSARNLGPNVNAMLPMSKKIAPSIVDDPDFRDDLTGSELWELEDKYTDWYSVGSGGQGVNWLLLENTWSTESISSNVYRNIFYEFSVNYLQDFGKHSVSGLALMSRQQRATGSEFFSYREDWVGRATYAYDRKYLFEVNAAYNGSEKFDRKYRFGLFPSVAIGWVVSNEQFFKSLIPVFNNLKFRYSDGVVGSDAGIARWLYTGSYIVHPEGGGEAETTFFFGAPNIQRGYPLSYTGVIPNPDIHWETARKRDFGVEAGFLNNMIRINFDHFKENRTNVFIASTDMSLPNYFGAPAVASNLGQVDVYGWELEAEFRKTTAQGLTFWASYAWSFSKDKIIKKSDPELQPSYQKQAGYQIGQPRVTLNQGTNSVMNSWNDVYLTVGGENTAQTLPGDFMRVDYNSDGVINADDNVPYGYPARPQFTYAPSAGIAYKGLSANLRFYGVYNLEGTVGYEAQNYTQAGYEAVVFTAFLEEAWSPEFGVTNNAIRSATRFKSSGSSGYVARSRAYLRLESAEIAYSMNSNNNQWLNSLRLSNLRIRLSGNNLFLWSKILMDKDADAEGVNAIYGYPILKRYNLGITVDF